MCPLHYRFGTLNIVRFKLFCWNQNDCYDIHFGSIYLLWTEWVMWLKHSLFLSPFNIYTGDNIGLYTGIGQGIEELINSDVYLVIHLPVVENLQLVTTQRSSPKNKQTKRRNSTKKLGTTWCYQNLLAIFHKFRGFFQGQYEPFFQMKIWNKCAFWIWWFSLKLMWSLSLEIVEERRLDFFQLSLNYIVNVFIKSFWFSWIKTIDKNSWFTEKVFIIT